MSFQVLAFGLWSAESSQVDGSGQTLKAIFATAFLFGLVGLGVAGIGALRNWWAASKSIQAARPRQDAGDDRDPARQRTGRHPAFHADLRRRQRQLFQVARPGAQEHALPRQARPGAGMVKFLIAENEKMQRDAADLQRNLEHSSSQIEKLRWNLAEAQELGLRDPLTALSNRRCFDVNLAKEIEEAHAHSTAMCLVMGDIDSLQGNQRHVRPPDRRRDPEDVRQAAVEQRQGPRYGGALRRRGIRHHPARDQARRRRAPDGEHPKPARRQGAGRQQQRRSRSARSRLPSASPNSASATMPTRWCSVPTPGCTRPSAPAATASSSISLLRPEQAVLPALPPVNAIVEQALAVEAILQLLTALWGQDLLNPGTTR